MFANVDSVRLLWMLELSHLKQKLQAGA